MTSATSTGRDTETTYAVEVRDLTKTFASARGEPVRAVDGIDLLIEPGEIVAFLGPNGAGKTTTLDMVLGLTEPTSGTARVLGQNPRAAVDRGRVSAVLQTGGLLGDLTVRETVRLIGSFFPALAGVTAPERVDRVLERAGITTLAGRKVSKCSGGEQQRLRFALALLPEPDLLILDEPTAGLDVNARREFWDTMRADAASGRTVVFATHYLEEADTFAERIVLIAGGKIVADGSTEEIRSRSGGRVLTADVDVVRHPDTAATLLELPGVSAATMRGRRLEVRASAARSDDIARILLGELSASNLEISGDSLENAFVALTASPVTGENPDPVRSQEQNLATKDTA
jgi:ABC-2 type transport system ATP-binding protein